MPRVKNLREPPASSDYLSYRFALREKEFLPFDLTSPSMAMACACRVVDVASLLIGTTRVRPPDAECHN